MLRGLTGGYDPGPFFQGPVQIVSFIAATIRVALILSLLGASASAAPDTLVVCPAEFREALAPWESYRRDQGHVLAVIEPPSTAKELHAEIRRAAGDGRLKFVVLIGDVPAVPTGYVDARINVRWGSEPTIATDQLYADVDGDDGDGCPTSRSAASRPIRRRSSPRSFVRCSATSRKRTMGRGGGV